MMKLSKPEFNLLTQYIHKSTGLKINENKLYLVEQRLEPVALTCGARNFAELICKLTRNDDIQLRDHVIEAITTNETSFFRDGRPFDVFREYILPELCETIMKRKTRKQTRKGARAGIWCAASSTGQEAYSIAMTIHDYTEVNSGAAPNDFSVLATDISSAVLARAISGKYTQMELARGISPERKEKYFIPSGNHWKLKNNIQGMVEFRKVNLAEQFTMLGGFDIIFCRNVLIYFDDNAKRRIIAQFREMLSEGGYLLLGACENMNMLSDGFERIRRKGVLLYKKKV